MAAVEIPVSHGRLEGLLAKVEAPRAAAVVCHPHPLYGGSMHNPVTYRIAEALQRAGVTALRFNFRGVGGSSGEYDEGRGEVEDARAALDFLAQEEPGMPLYAAGFSFGSWVALELLRGEARLEKGLAVGMPLDLMPFGFLEQLAKPVAFIHADQDEYGRLREVRALVERAPGPKALYVVSEADHMYVGRMSDFTRVASEAAGWLLQSGSGAASAG